MARSKKENPILSMVSEEDIEVQDAVILQLPPKIQRFIHLYCTGQYSHMKLAQLLDVSPNTITAWLKRDDVKDVMLNMQSSIHEVVSMNIKAMSVSATEKLKELIHSPIDGVALQAVKDILDRTGHKPEQKIKVDKTVTTIEQKLQNLIDATIIEGEYTIVEESDN